EEISIPAMVAGYFNFDTNIRVSALDTTQESANNNNSFNAPLKFTFFPGILGNTNTNNLSAENSVIAVADYDAEGNMYLYSSYVVPGTTVSKPFLSSIQMGLSKNCKVTGGIDHKGLDLYASFADYDNDGHQDL